MWQKGGKGGCSTQNLLLWWEIRQVWKYDLCAREHWKFDQLSSVAIVLNNIELKLCVAIMEEQRGVLSRRI